MKKTLNYFMDVIVLFIAIVGFLSIALLAIGWFQVPLVVVTGLLLTVIISFLRQNYNFKKIKKEVEETHLAPIIVLVLIALLLRADPYFYVIGGQDQGVYVNMSAAFESTGQIFQEDDVRQKIQDDFIRELYDRYNYKIEKRPRVRVNGEREGKYLLGIYLKNVSKSELVFQFYHLHPVWMAIFGRLFGTENRVYSLTVFSILSVVYLYLLSFEISGSRFLAFTTGTLIALNPLHAFFSKFPVTEVVSLFFSSSSFYYLLRYYKKSQAGTNDSYDLILSSGLIGSFFFTRISGFMYIPFFYILLILTLYYVDEPQTRRNLLMYYLSVLTFYILSVLYGIVYSFPYSYNIHVFSLSHLFGEQWKIKTVVSSAIIVIMTPFFHFWTQKNNFKERLVSFIKKMDLLLPYTILAVLALGMYQVYELGFTDIYKGNKSLDVRWSMAGNGFDSFSYSSIIVSITYISPFLFLIFVYSLFVANKYARIVMLFLLSFWAYISFFQWLIPYQYYYARYLLSEVVPYSILLAVSASGNLLNHRYKRLLFYLILALTCCYYLYFSVHQLKGKEVEGAYESLRVIASYLDEDDLLLLYRSGFVLETEIKTPLVYLFNKNVFTYNDADELGAQLLPKLIQNENFNELFVLSQKKLYTTYLESIDVVTYKRRTYEYVNTIPLSMDEVVLKFYLYKVNQYKLYNDMIQDHHQLFLSSNPYLVKKGFYEDGQWTTSHASISNLDFVAYGRKYVIIETNKWHPFRYDLAELNLNILTNGRELEFSHYENNKYYFFCPPDINKIERIDIYVNPFIPSQVILGSQDDRNLGLDVREISFE